MRRLRDHAVSLLERFLARLTVTETTLAEFQSSTTLVLIGLVFLDGRPSFGTLGVYDVMSRVAPEAAWGLFCVVLGTAQGIANVLRHRRGRLLSAFVGSVFFGFIALLTTMGSPTSTALPVYGTFSLIQALVYLRLSIRESGRSGAHHAGA